MFRSPCLCPCQHVAPWRDPYPYPAQNGPDAAPHYAAEVHAHRSHACCSVEVVLAVVYAHDLQTLLSVCAYGAVAHTAAHDLCMAAVCWSQLRGILGPALTQTDPSLQSKLVVRVLAVVLQCMSRRCVLVVVSPRPGLEQCPPPNPESPLLAMR